MCWAFPIGCREFTLNWFYPRLLFGFWCHDPPPPIPFCVCGCTTWINAQSSIGFCVFVDLLHYLWKYNVLDVANYLYESVCKPACCVYLHWIGFGLLFPLTCQLLQGLSYCVIESTWIWKSTGPCLFVYFFLFFNLLGHYHGNSTHRI